MQLDQWLTLPDYSRYTLGTYLLYAAFGTLGLIVRVTATGASLSLPARGRHGWTLGSLGEWVTAVTVALLADHNALVAVAAAAGAPYIVHAFLRWLPQALGRVAVVLLDGLDPERRR